ncbi:MAG: CRISPR/Cas system-associated exonuclease Cas4 (RecB family) [Saprospiraceae bacterium]
MSKRGKTNNPVPKHTLSKTSFMQYLACPGELYLAFQAREKSIEEAPSLEMLHIFEQGNLIDNLAQDWFPLYWQQQNNQLSNISFQLVVETADYFVRADIVVGGNSDKSIHLIEVKASTGVKEEHIFDLAFQRMVFEKAGFQIESILLIHVNREYRIEKETDYSKLLSIEDCTGKVATIFPTIEPIARQALACINGQQPLISLFSTCGAKLDCAFVRTHFPDIPDYHIGKIANLRSKKYQQLLEQGILDIKDIPADFPLSAKQCLQVEVAQQEQASIQHQAIKDVLDELVYPLYFLDYESFPYVIPCQTKYGPYSQMLIQYSLHTISEVGAKPVHTEYLLDAKTEPVENLIHQLQQEITSTTGTVIVWHKAFESTRHKELALLYPQFANFVQSLNARIFDLKEIFSKGLYVDARFNGSASLKAVLPVLCPELSYHDLVINNGILAGVKWHHMTSEGKMTEEEQAATRRDLLRYCELDTWAMVRIWEELQKFKE